MQFLYEKNCNFFQGLEMKLKANNCKVLRIKLVFPFPVGQQ